MRPPRRHRQRSDLTLDRLLILARLLIGRWRTLAELAEHLGCSIRSIQRGIVTLRRAGLDIDRRCAPNQLAEFRLLRRAVDAWLRGM